METRVLNSIAERFPAVDVTQAATSTRRIYLSVPEEYFKTGVIIAGMEEQRYLIATPEKALCDLLILTPGLRIQSAGAMYEYLEAFLRFDMDKVAAFDLDIVKECIETGRKKTTLYQLAEVIKRG